MLLIRVFGILTFSVNNTSMKHLLFHILIIGAFSNFAQEKKVLDHSSYAEWKKIDDLAISGNGSWVSYTLNTNAEDNLAQLVNAVNKHVQNQKGGGGGGGSEYEGADSGSLSVVTSQVSVASSSVSPIIPALSLPGLVQQRDGSSVNGGGGKVRQHRTQDGRSRTHKTRRITHFPFLAK